MYEYDGQTYQDGSQKHDIGSFVCYETKQEETTNTLYLRHYYGKSSDVSKLPKYDSLATGSTAYCLDTGDLYMYDAQNKTWIPQ